MKKNRLSIKKNFKFHYISKKILFYSLNINVLAVLDEHRGHIAFKKNNIYHYLVRNPPQLSQQKHCMTASMEINH